MSKHKRFFYSLLLLFLPVLLLVVVVTARQLRLTKTETKVEAKGERELSKRKIKPVFFSQAGSNKARHIKGFIIKMKRPNAIYFPSPLRLKRGNFKQRKGVIKRGALRSLHMPAAMKKLVLKKHIIAVRKLFNNPKLRAPFSKLVYVVDLSSALNTQQILLDKALLEKSPNIDYVDLNVDLHVHYIPNDTYYGSSGSWGNNYQDQWDLYQINAQAYYNRKPFTTPVEVAVIDTGVDSNHEDFTPGTVTLGKNYLSDNPSDKAIDDSGHGTHVAGTIAAATNNNKGIASTGEPIHIYAEKVCDSSGLCPLTAITKAITDAALRGVKVINLSLGGPDDYNVIEDVVNFAMQKNVIVVASAGNSNIDAHRGTIAGIPGVVTVSATDQTGKPSIYSNYGTPVEVAAPGGDMTMNVLSLRASKANLMFNPYRVGENYLRLSGTSMSAPHTTALVAAIVGYHPNWTTDQVKDALFAGVSNLSENPLHKYGYGIIDVDKTLSIDKPVLVAPYELVARVNYTKREVIIEWKELNIFAQYGINIYRSNDNKSFRKINTSPIPKNTLKFTDSVNSGTYYYYLKTVLPDGNESSPSATVVEEVPTFFSQSSKVNGNEQSNRFLATQAVDSFGNIYVAWVSTEGQDSSHSDIHFAKSSDNGLHFEKEKNINNTKQDYWDYFPNIGIGANDNIYLSYEELNNQNGSIDIVVAKSRDFGENFSVKQIAKTAYLGSHWKHARPQMYISGNDINIVWQEKTKSNDKQAKVFYVASHDGGEHFESPKIIDSVPLIEEKVSDCNPQPVIKGNKGGKIYIVFSKCAFVSNNNYDKQIYMSVSENNGKTFGTPYRISHPLSDYAPIMNNPSVDVDEGGRIYVSFSMERWSAPHDAFALIMSDDGGKNFTRSMIVGENSSIAPTSSLFNKVAVSKGGDIFVSWGEVFDDRLIFKELERNGNELISKGVIFLTATNIYGPDMSYGNFDDLVAAYRKSDNNIYFVHFLANQSLSFKKGWNDFSLILDPGDLSVKNIFSTIAGKYDMISGEEGSYVPILNDNFNTLKKLSLGKGYSIEINKDNVSMQLKGNLTPLQRPINLHKGWNWVGYYLHDRIEVSKALKSIDGKYILVLSGDKEKRYDPNNSGESSLKYFYPGRMYLIRMQERATLVYPTHN